MYKFILSSLFVVLFFSFANAQSGLGYLKGYVKCGNIGNDGCAGSGATVTLKPIETHSKSIEKITTKTDSGGYFKIDASFGEYELIISANGYATYQTTVYIPSSVNLNWAVRLKKVRAARKNP